MENDPEATDKDNEEDIEPWLNYIQSQQLLVRKANRLLKI